MNPISSLVWNDSRLSTLLMLLTIILWGWTFVLVKDAIGSFGVIPFLAFRFSLAALCLLPWVFRTLSARTLRTGFAVGIVLGSAFLLQTRGLKQATASSAGLITGLFVVFAPLAGMLFFNRRTPAALWGIIAASVVGLLLLAGGGPQGIGTGEILLLCGAAGFGVHIALLDRYASDHPALSLAFGQMLGAAISIWIVFWARGEVLRVPTASVWNALLITGVFASALAYGVQSFAQRHLHPARISVLILLESVFAVGFGYVLHGDRLSLVQAAGAVVLLLSAGYASRVSCPQE